MPLRRKSVPSEKYSRNPAQSHDKIKNNFNLADASVEEFLADLRRNPAVDPEGTIDELVGSLLDDRPAARSKNVLAPAIKRSKNVLAKRSKNVQRRKRRGLQKDAQILERIQNFPVPSAAPSPTSSEALPSHQHESQRTTI